VQAEQRLQAQRLPDEVGQLFGNMRTIMQCFTMLGYRLESAIPWLKIGLPWDEGPLPDLTQVESRMRLATQLLTVAATMTSDDKIRHDLLAMITDISDAGKRCIELLPSLVVTRRRRSRDFLPRVLEVEANFLQYMRDTWCEGQSGHVFLQLSNLQEINLLTYAATPLQARLIHEVMNKDCQQIANILESQGLRRLVLWGPSDSPSTGRWLATFRKLWDRFPDLKLNLLLDRPLLPGRLPPKDVVDYWPTPWLTTVAKDWVEDVRLLYPPLKVLDDGPNGPRLRERTMGLITMTGTRHDTLPTPMATSWMPTGSEPQGKEAIVIDYDRAQDNDIRRLLTTITHDMIHTWSRPASSPADAKQRCTIYGYLREEASDLHCVLLVRKLYSMMAHVPHIAIGHTAIMHDPGALIAESQGPSGILAVVGLTEQLIFLSAKKAVLITTTGHTTWEESLTGQATADEPERVLRLSWRRSTRGGRTWVAPQVIGIKHKAEMTNDWMTQAGPTRGTIYVQLQGDIDEAPDRIGNNILSKLVEWTSRPWALLPLDSFPMPGQLAPARGRSGEWDGAFLIETDSPEQTTALAQCLNNSCFSGALGPRRLRVEVQNEYGNKVSSARPGGGRRRR
jgi:hypothetical protein